MEREGTFLLFAQKGAWTRLGVYVVHLSVLIILIGAITGTFFGFQAYVFLAEGRATDTIFLQGSSEPVPLGFRLQCDRFERTFYANGMIKQYHADLTVFDPARETPYRKSIIVNDPLTYRGLTFYQADSYPLNEFLVRIRNRTTGQEQAFRVPPEQEVIWQGTAVSFRVEELKVDEDGAVQQAKISFTADAAAEPSVFWMKDRDTLTIRQSDAEFSISFRQFYTTLLLVTKDPGVMIVYFGCLLMVVGLTICFFLAHRRIWVRISPGTIQGAMILVSGTSNKNKPAFADRFQELVNRLEQEATVINAKKDS
jgi:cytochrome c biogenesis protein